jgi:uncharacterized protein YecE (DUF72 family)
MILIGSCSWTEKTLIQSGEFYPKGVNTAKGRLNYYAGHFNTVEVDSSYYAIPDRNTVWLWTQRTPAEFTFHIKAHGSLTGHGVDPRTLPQDIRNTLPDVDREKRYVYIKDKGILNSLAERFVDVLSILQRDGKLGVLVFQFPPWFHYNPRNFDYILRCKKLMCDLPVAVEFRHGSWLTTDRAENIFRLLKEHEITYITADEPQYGSLATIPFMPQVTTDIAYFRFHGRNKQNWLRKGIETSLRYDYLYSDDEIKEFAGPVLSANKKAKSTFAMFNNCHGGFAMRNAMRLQEIIKGEGE